jgi:hypothetical protein
MAIWRATITALVITGRGRATPFDRLSKIRGENMGGGDLSVEENEGEKK